MNDQIKLKVEAQENQKSTGPELNKLSLRERYLLERDQIRNEIGDLSQILDTLGISQRKACQLLLVDPSAWTRWNKTSAPPHIYQALRWLVQLKKINPEAVGPTDLSTRLDHVQSNTSSKLRILEESLGYLEKKLVLAHQLSSRQTVQPETQSMIREINRLNHIVEELQEKLDGLSRARRKSKRKKPQQKARARAVMKRSPKRSYKKKKPKPHMGRKKKR